MDWFDAAGYELARQVAQRGVAALYAVAFASTLAQFRVLLGEHGLLPVPRFLDRVGSRAGPTLFRWRYSDRLLVALAVCGVVVSLLLVAGIPQAGPPWLPAIAFLAIWFGYLSIVNVGQTFYAFGWESLLVEAGFVVAFLGSAQTAPPITIIVFLRWLVFRLEFGAGMIKLRGDRSWRDLTALYYHHETQPMPGPLSWFFHHLPRPLHRAEVLGNHFAQLVVPFFLFAPQPVASIAAGLVILTQLWLVFSGNFAWLNAITIVLAFSAVSDPVAHAVIPAWPAVPVYQLQPGWFVIVVLVVTVLLVALSYYPLRNLFSRRQLMNASFNRWHLVNAYGAFGSVTKRRFEVVVEATQAEHPGPEDWKAYEFKGKPGDPGRLPRQFAPYHLRLDWLMWFLALGSRPEQWFLVFAIKLLQADPATLRLLRSAPFGRERPRYVRARMFRYRFSSPQQLRRDHVWWVREPAGELLPPVSLPPPSGAGRAGTDGAQPGRTG